MRTKLAILPKLLLVLTFLSFLSCHKKEEVPERIQLCFRNKVGKTIQISLFPKEKYLASGTTYWVWGKEGGASPTNYRMVPDLEENVLYSREFNLSPDQILTQRFDSVYVQVSNVTTLKFYPDTVIGASVNMFTEESAWEYIYQKNTYPINGSSFTVWSHDYTFVFKGLD